jgi:hypothetical protein
LPACGTAIRASARRIQRCRNGVAFLQIYAALNVLQTHPFRSESLH